MVIENRKYNLMDALKIPIKSSPGYSLTIALKRVLDGIVPTLKVLVTAKFIDTAILLVNGTVSFRNLLPWLISLILLIAYTWISDKLIQFVDVKMQLSMRREFRTAVTEKRAKLSYKHIENPDTWDLISRVSDNPEMKVKDSYNTLLLMTAMIIEIIGILIILLAKVWWAAFVIVAFSVPLFIIAIKGGKKTYEAHREVSKYNRKAQYLGEVLTGREGVEERSLFNFGEAVNKTWWEQYETARKIELKTTAKWFIKMKSGSIVTAIISILIICVLLNPVKSGAISIGMFISLVNSIFRLVQMMSWQLTYYMDELAKISEYFKDVTKFAALEEATDAICEPSKEVFEFKNLEFKDVKFKYPGTDKYILNGASFNIENGKHYAFVGSNGAGKTTITKLITGLYDEYEGDIFVNGKNLREFTQKEIKSISSVVYQDFAKYYISFKDNIALGNINSINTDENDNLIKSAIKTMEIEDAIENLPNGMETALGKIKSGGVDISGGQWQRIAMARGIVSPAPLKILDEPTAALDPISESNVYEKFEEISRGGTTIFISHRLGSTKLADEILVIGEGQIIEKGTHNELMEMNGVYKEMYENQRGWYK